jgi:hypothetical protein
MPDNWAEHPRDTVYGIWREVFDAADGLTVVQCAAMRDGVQAHLDYSRSFAGADPMTKARAVVTKTAWEAVVVWCEINKEPAFSKKKHGPMPFTRRTIFAGWFRKALSHSGGARA